MLEILDGLEFHESLGAFHLGSGGGWGREKAKDRECQAHAGDSKEVWFHSFRYRFSVYGEFAVEIWMGVSEFQDLSSPQWGMALPK